MAAWGWAVHGEMVENWDDVLFLAVYGVYSSKRAKEAGKAMIQFIVSRCLSNASLND